MVGAYACAVFTQCCAALVESELWSFLGCRLLVRVLLYTDLSKGYGSASRKCSKLFRPLFASIGRNLLVVHSTLDV
jgi:hypothetical protein